MSWIEMVALDPNNQRGYVFGSRLACYKMNAKLYVKYSIEYRCLVLIRVSLRAANCAWPWLDTKKKSLIWELFPQAHLNWSSYPGWRSNWTRWTIDFLVKKQNDLYFLFMIIKPLRRAHVNSRSFVGSVDYLCMMLVQVLLLGSRAGCAWASPV